MIRRVTDQSDRVYAQRKVEVGKYSKISFKSRSLGQAQYIFMASRMDLSLCKLPLPRTSPDDDALRHLPLISVIVPCFNAGPYVKEGLASIYAQDYPRFEVILVDDGSTGDSFLKL